ncbi:calcium/proton exchanger, variant [Phialophora macrospora]|uniref:Calcium/proton exchanger, variant n=1 Tax=Phialophora macrospora TaxID=1851006 RepID=A0A0D2FJ33_9EURO|nr:calcium/proton exchanger, variant [Phialophora macrospora]
MSSSDNPQRSSDDRAGQDVQSTTRSSSVAASVGGELRSQDEPVGGDTTIRRDYGTLNSNAPDTPSTMPVLSPQTTRVRKPPPMVRRISTRRQLPHRGEHFSVDDDPDEVEEDRELQTPTTQSFPAPNRSHSTVRRRTAAAPSLLARVDSAEEETEELAPQESAVAAEEEAEPEVQEEPLEESEDADISDTESFTLRDRQLAINETHPFGIRIWKPALYKKSRSVEKGAEEDIHSSPSQIVSTWLWFFNCLWTVLFGWWLSAAALFGALICYLFAFNSSAVAYGRVFLGLANYLFWPFGKFVRLEQDENYVEEDEGEGRSISEYERWQSGDLEYGRLMFGPILTHTGSIVGRHRNSIDSASENDGLLDRGTRADRQDTGASVNAKSKRRLFGRGQWTLGRVMFFIFFYFNVAPLMLLVSLICWLMVFWIPMGRVTLILFYHLRKRPLALTFHRDVSHVRSSTKPTSILLCTYRAVGIKYWKYTIDGTNIFLINFLAVVAFVIFDYFVLKVAAGLDFWLTSPALMFTLALISIIPLAYFIGQAVASISAQSSMGMGAAVNAFFSTIVEVYLYCIALNEGKASLVEGSIIGSILAGILLLPGLSMCFGAIKRKTQRFNVRSASATSTMLLFAVIAAFGPTLFYKIYGSHELICRTCTAEDIEAPRDCRQCYFRQLPAVTDDFFVKAVRPYCWIAAILLFSSYIIGLLFTLRTHAAIIWSTDDERKPQAPPTADVSPMDTRHQSAVNSQTLPKHDGYLPKSAIRESQLYRKILGQSLQSAGLPDGDGILDRDGSGAHETTSQTSAADPHNKGDLPHLVPPKSGYGRDDMPSPSLYPVVPGLSEEDNNNFVRQVAELAATAATIATRDAVNHPNRASWQATHAYKTDTVRGQKPSVVRRDTVADDGYPNAAVEQAAHPAAEGGGHDAPNWSRAKSSIILLTATLAYAIVAEILVDTVDVVLESVDIDEKFLGITLFALVPNTTEFLNGISFAMNGNIALSMEIGSAYALQVCLLQLPALVLFTALRWQFIDPSKLIDHTFNLIFPQWDMVTIILCVFLLSYMSGEGKSNYFKGSILVLTYLVVVLGFYFSGFTSMTDMGANPNDTLAIMSSMAWQQHVPGGVTTRVISGREL